MQRWRRFERCEDNGSTAYWAIRVDGSRWQLREGRVGEPELRSKTRGYADEARAQDAAAQKIQRKLRTGWVEVAPPSEPSPALDRGAALERALAEDPSDANWAVYADFLHDLDPVLGERVALGLARARAESDDARAELDARIAQLEATHARTLLGPTLAGIVGEEKFGGLVQLRYKYGLITEAKLDARARKNAAFVPVVAALLELPAARALMALDLRARPRWFAAVFEQLVARPRPALRRLALEALARVEAIDPLPLERLLERTPALVRLDVSGPLTGVVEHPSLRELRLLGPPDSPAPPLDRWRAPALEQLHVLEPEPIDWARVELPQLRGLLIKRDGLGDAPIAALVGAPLLEQLDSLILDDCNLLGRPGELLLAHAERFARLRRFGLVDVDVEPDLLAELRARLPNLEVVELSLEHDDRDDPLNWEQWEAANRRRRTLTAF